MTQREIGDTIVDAYEQGLTLDITFSDGSRFPHEIIGRINWASGEFFWMVLSEEGAKQDPEYEAGDYYGVSINDVVSVYVVSK